MHLRTARLLLRDWSEADAPALLAMYSDPEVTRYIPHVALTTLEAAVAKIRQMAGHDPTMWAVDDESGLVGVCGFRQGEAELGFAFARRCWGKGYAVEAGRACLEAFPFEKVIAQTRGENVGSRRVLEKLGFRDTGRRDDVWWVFERP